MIKQPTLNFLRDKTIQTRISCQGIVHNILPRGLALLIGMLVTIPGLSQAVPLTLSDVPLPISTAVEPNVMLLLDTSGSMKNIVWETGTGAYVDSTDYSSAPFTDWSGAGSNWAANGRNINISSFSSSCSSSTKSCDVTSGAKTLTLPDPLGSGNTQYSGNYLNYLFNTYPTGSSGSDLTDGDIPITTRLDDMKDVANTLIDSTTGIRFGLASFNNGSARIDQNCDTRTIAETEVLTTAITGFTARGGTPLGESLYKITRYFRDLEGGRPSPIQYRCQKNFTIIVTDGLPTNDSTYPSSDPALAATCTRLAGLVPPEASLPCTLKNWDQIDTPGIARLPLPTPPAVAPLRFSDGPGGDGEGGTLILDDIAKFAYDIDMRTGINPLTGKSFDAADYPQQNMETFTVGFSIDTQVLEDAAHYGAGLKRDDPVDTNPLTTHYFTANNRAQLLTQLQTAITNIEGRSSSAASVASNTGSISNSSLTYLYQGLFESNYWTGDIIGHEFVVDPITKLISFNVVAKASAQLATLVGTNGTSNSNRNITTYNTTTNTGIDFTWASLSPPQQVQLLNRQEILNYIRGDQTCETNNAANCTVGTKDLRDRFVERIDGKPDVPHLIGSVINSSPIYIGTPSLRYPDIWPGPIAPENSGQKYSDFKEAQKNRKPMVYVGANDGMLHAFNGVAEPLEPANDLKEQFAYIPGSVYPDLAEYSLTNYNHKYFVDGTPTIIDAFYSGTWKTVLVGGLNKGGQGIFALDVTNPLTFSSSNVLWEYSDADDPDLGYTFSRPAIIRLKNGKWAAVFGNGYNNDETDDNISTTGNASLFIVDIETGTLIKKIPTNVGIVNDPNNLSPDPNLGRSNGLATVAAVDLNGDYVSDYIYAGDLFGNLWRFDITSTDPANWAIFGRGSDPTTSPIFVAKDAGGKAQPITVRPEIARTTSSGLMIYFGTGLYIQDTDKVNTDSQSFYGVLDNPEREKLAGSPTPAEIRSGMIQQTVDQETIFSGTENVRRFSNNAGSDTYTSWFIDLPTPGERVIGQPLVRGSAYKRVIFTTIIPTEDACGFGGSSWLIELDGRNGNRTKKAVFDLNYDGKLDKNDNGGGSLGDVYNGWSHSGIITSPTVITGSDTEYKVMSSSTGKLPSITEALPPGTSGRIMWQQLK